MEFHWKIVGVNGISWEYGNITVIISWRVVRVVQDLLILFWNDSPGLKLMCHNETQGTTGLTIFRDWPSNFCTPILTNTKIMAVGVCKIMVRRGWAAGLQFPAEYQPDFSQPWRGQPPQFTKGFSQHLSLHIDILQIFLPRWIQVWVRLKIGTRNSNGLYGLSICFILNYEHGHFITGAIPAIPQFSNNPIILLWV